MPRSRYLIYLRTRVYRPNAFRSLCRPYLLATSLLVSKSFMFFHRSVAYGCLAHTDDASPFHKITFRKGRPSDIRNQILITAMNASQQNTSSIGLTLAPCASGCYPLRPPSTYRQSISLALLPAGSSRFNDSTITTITHPMLLSQSTHSYWIVVTALLAQGYGSSGLTRCNGIQLERIVRSSPIASRTGQRNGLTHSINCHANNISA